jgi:hypothetical protein
VRDSENAPAIPAGSGQGSGGRGFGAMLVTDGRDRLPEREPAVNTSSNWFAPSAPRTWATTSASPRRRNGHTWRPARRRRPSGRIIEVGKQQAETAALHVGPDLR